MNLMTGIFSEIETVMFIQLNGLQSTTHFVIGCIIIVSVKFLKKIGHFIKLHFSF